MPCLLLLMWVTSAIALWSVAINGLRDVWATAEAGRRTSHTTAIVACVIPPTVVLCVTAFVLLQAAPTVQFNAGSSRAFELWSFWVRWYQNIFGGSMLMTGIYAACLFGSLVSNARWPVRNAVGVGFLTSLWGSILLGMAYPTA